MKNLKEKNEGRLGLLPIKVCSHPNYHQIINLLAYVRIVELKGGYRKERIMSVGKKNGNQDLSVFFISFRGFLEKKGPII